MATSEHVVLVGGPAKCTVVVAAAVASKVEAFRRDAVGSIKDRCEHDVVVAPEEAKKGRLPVVHVEAAEEPGVDDEAPPLLADNGGARER